MTKGEAEALILDHMRASSPHTVWPMPEDSDPDMYCGYLSFEQVGKLADALSHRPTKGEIDALIAEARAQAKWWRSADHAEGRCSRPNSQLFDALADALSLLGDGGGGKVALIAEVAGLIDKQLYEHKRLAGFDSHDDDEWCVSLTARQWRVLDRALASTALPASSYGR